MLATAEQVKHATELTREEVCLALGRGGYRDAYKEISEVRFKGFNGNSFVYEISFPDPESDEGFLMTGSVYVTLRRQAFGTSFEFYADY